MCRQKNRWRTHQRLIHPGSLAHSLHHVWQSHRPRRPSSLVGSRLWWILYLRIISPPFQARWSENGYGGRGARRPGVCRVCHVCWWGRDENGMKERSWWGDTQRSKWRLKSGMTFKPSQVFRYLIIGTARTAAVPRAPPPPPSNVCFQALLWVVIEWPQSPCLWRSEGNCHSRKLRGRGREGGRVGWVNRWCVQDGQKPILMRQ